MEGLFSCTSTTPTQTPLAACQLIMRESSESGLGGMREPSATPMCASSHGLRSPISQQRQARRKPMLYDVTEACIRCKYTDGMEICPVDCFPCRRR